MNCRSVQIFAASYVRRFFITRSILQYDPRVLCAAAYLLAIKADDYPGVEASVLGSIFQVDPKDILKNEQILMYGINFEIFIHTPLRVCHVLYLFCTY